MIQKFISTYLYPQFRIAVFLLVALSILTGFIYPILVTSFAQILFPHKANGSLMIKEKKLIGSELIGQEFNDIKYFWGRPSATAPFPYNAEASQGSNLGPNNPSLMTKIQDRIKRLRKRDPKNTKPIPIELITASGSGLDPHITPLAAFYQVDRIAKVRHLSEKELENLITQLIEKPQFGFLDSSRINVLKLNVALDMLSEKRVD